MFLVKGPLLVKGIFINSYRILENDDYFLCPGEKSYFIKTLCPWMENRSQFEVRNKSINEDSLLRLWIRWVGGGEDTVTDSGALSSSHLTLINDCAPRGKKIETGLARASRHATPRRLEPLTSQQTWCSGTQQSINHLSYLVCMQWSSQTCNQRTYIDELRYSDHHGKRSRRGDYELSTDPNPQNTFILVSVKHILTS